MPRKSRPPLNLEITPVWKQQPDEPDLWFNRFNRWLRMIDPEQGIFKRSLRQIFIEEEMAKQKAGAVKPGKNRQSYLTLPPDWSVVGKNYRWKERAQAFDRHHQDIEDSLWDERMKKLREQRWKMSETLFQKAEMMSKMPLVEQTITTNNGRQITVIKPVDWSLRDVVAFLKAASELGGEACGDYNWAASLITNAGFEIINPLEARDEEADDLPDEELE